MKNSIRSLTLIGLGTLLLVAMVATEATPFLYAESGLLSQSGKRMPVRWRGGEVGGAVGPGMGRAQAAVTGTPTPTLSAAGLPAPTLTAADPLTTTVELSWTTVPDAERYELRVWWKGLSDWQLATDSVLTSTSYSHSGRTPGETYYYLVAAVDRDGKWGLWSEQVTVIVPESVSFLAAPNLMAEAGVGQITLTWEMVANAVSYQLTVWDGEVSDWRGVGGTLEGAHFIHEGLNFGTAYYYHIRAVSAEGHTSEWSEQVSATAAAPRTATPTVTATPTPTPTYTIPRTAASKERAALVSLFEATNGANWENSDNWLTDQPVATWYGVLTDESGHISHLLLDDNGLYGSIPDLGALTRLRSLRLASNQLTGPIPDLRNLINLRLLHLPSNRLNGAVPFLGSMANLTHLILVDNELSGQIPDLEALKELRVLDLGSNQLNGPVPPLETLANLRTLSLNGNKLSGQIPDLDALTDLSYLNLGSNRLTGPIPPLTSLSRLTHLQLNDNLLDGQVPNLSSLTSLSRLSLNGNELNGRIPELRALTNLKYLDLSHNQFSGEIPSLNDLTRLSWLDLSNNSLTGRAPELNALVHLKGLLLNDNQLSGQVPDLGPLSDLAWLDLSDNLLTGSILDLNNLTSLEGLILSRNRLTGPFPDLRALTGLTWLDLRDNQLCLPISAYNSASVRVVSIHLDRLAPAACIDAAFSEMPGRPLNVTATSGDGQVTLTWDRAANAVRYDLLAWDSFERKWETVDIAVRDSTTYTQTVRTDGRNYYFQVRARGPGKVRGAWSERTHVGVVPTQFPPPPRSFGFAMYFQKYMNVGGIVVAAPSVVSDDQLIRMQGVISGLLANRPDLHQEMAANNTTVFVRESDEWTVSAWNANVPVVDPHCGTFIREFSRLIHFAIVSLSGDSDYLSRLYALYRATSSSDSELGGIDAATVEEFWAEAVGNWLWRDLSSSLATSNETQAGYEPEVVKLIEDVLGEVEVPSSCIP